MSTARPTFGKLSNMPLFNKVASKPVKPPLSLAILLVAIGLSPSQAKAQILTAPASGFATRFVLTNDHILIPATLNGKGPFTFLLDTGANANILLSSVAQQIGAPLGPPTTMNGFGAANSNAQQTQPVSIAINNAPQPNQGFLILDSALQVAKTALPLQGLLGLPLLQHQVVFLDFAHQGIATFSAQLPRSRWPTFTGQQSVHFTLDDTGIALIPMTINGVTGNFQLDTGSNVGIILYSQFALAHPGAFSGGISTLNFGGTQIGGAVQMSMINHAAVAIGTMNGIAAPVYISGSTPPSAQGKEIAGNIGVAFLKQFEVLIDYPDALLTLTPSPLSAFSQSNAAQPASPSR